LLWQQSDPYPVEVLKISVLNEMIGDDEDRTEQKDK
jgi:hypothetical protein